MFTFHVSVSTTSSCVRHRDRRLVDLFAAQLMHFILPRGSTHGWFFPFHKPTLPVTERGNQWQRANVTISAVRPVSVWQGRPTVEWHYTANCASQPNSLQSGLTDLSAAFSLFVQRVDSSRTKSMDSAQIIDTYTNKHTALRADDAIAEPRAGGVPRDSD